MSTSELFAYMSLVVFGGGWLVAQIIIYIVVPIVLAILFITSMLVGIIGDWRHDRKVRYGKARPRLPFNYRWKGWKVGMARREDTDQYVHSYYDSPSLGMTPIVRKKRCDRARRS